MSDIRKFGNVEVDMDAVRESAPLWEAALRSEMRLADLQDKMLRSMKCPYCGEPVKTDEQVHICVPVMED